MCPAMFPVTHDQEMLDGKTCANLFLPKDSLLVRSPQGESAPKSMATLITVTSIIFWSMSACAWQQSRHCMCI